MHTEGLVEIKVKVMGAAALLNIIINFVFIPRLGVTGAIISTITTEIFLLLSFHLVLNRKL